MHSTRSIVLALAVALGAAACGSSSKDAAAPAAAPPPAAGVVLSPEAEALAAELVPLFERMLSTFETSAGHCDALAEDIADFARSDDGQALRRFYVDPAQAARFEAHGKEIGAAYPALGTRMGAVMAPCHDSVAVRDALDHSGLGRKVKVDADGTAATDDLPGER